MKTSRLAIIAGLFTMSVAAHATFYTTEASFLAAINPTYYLEDFSNFTFGSPLDGSQTSWSAPGGNGYGWDASAAGGLWSNDSALSTNSANDPIGFTFTGSPVTAFGGVIANTDISGNIIGGTATLTMSNGDTATVNSNSFLGWVGSSAVSGATLTATGGGSGLDWAQADHVYTGQAAAVPEPATMVGLAMGALALMRRRKKA